MGYQVDSSAKVEKPAASNLARYFTRPLPVMVSSPRSARAAQSSTHSSAVQTVSDANVLVTPPSVSS